MLIFILKLILVFSPLVFLIIYPAFILSGEESKREEERENKRNSRK
jgi:cytochrome c biogenesis protein CcdA